MANKAVGWAWDQDTDRPIDKMVLVALADYAGKDGFSYPSLRELAAMAQCSQDSVRRSLKRLIDRGLIISEERWRANGGRSTNGYTVLYLGPYSEAYRRVEEGADEVAPPSQIARGAPSQNAGGSLAPVQGGPSQLCKGHNDPSTYPSIEKSARAGACEAGASPARAEGAAASLVVRRGDKGWSTWLQHVPAHIAEQAEAAGAIEVPFRFPGRDSQIIALVHPNGVSEQPEASAAPSASTERRTAPAIAVRRGDPSWAHWMAAIGVEQAAKAEASGEIAVTARWPKGDGARLIGIAVQIGGAP